MAIEIVDFPMKHGGSFHSYVKLPEGTVYSIYMYILYAREVQRAKTTTARQENELTPGLTVREQIELGAKWKPHEWLSNAINNFVDWDEMIWWL